MVQHDEASWDQIYYDIDTILNDGTPENREGGRKARIITTNWKPKRSKNKTEDYTAPDEIPVPPILKASARDRRAMFR